MSALPDALSYAARGWRIFPTLLIKESNGKVRKQPAIRDWPNTCSRDHEQIREWWKRWPGAIPSIVTGPRNGIVILDLDIGTDSKGRPYSGFDGLEALGKGALPPTPIVHTRSGGIHYWFSCRRAPDDKRLEGYAPKGIIRNSASILAPHVDVRGWNGQAVLPAAVGGYSWDPELNLETVALVSAPAWFDYRPPKQYQTQIGDRTRLDPAAVLAEACRRIRTAAEGTRHDTYRHEVFRVARLVGVGLIDERRAQNDLAAEVMALGQLADGHLGRVSKYFAASWAEGLAAAGRSRR